MACARVHSADFCPYGSCCSWLVPGCTVQTSVHMAAVAHGLCQGAQCRLLSIWQLLLMACARVHSADFCPYGSCCSWLVPGCTVQTSVHMAAVAHGLCQGAQCRLLSIWQLLLMACARVHSADFCPYGSCCSWLVPGCTVQTSVHMAAVAHGLCQGAQCRLLSIWQLLLMACARVHSADFCPYGSCCSWLVPGCTVQTSVHMAAVAHGLCQGAQCRLLSIWQLLLMACARVHSADFCPYGSCCSWLVPGCTVQTSVHMAAVAHGLCQGAQCRLLSIWQLLLMACARVHSADFCPYGSCCSCWSG